MLTLTFSLRFHYTNSCSGGAAKVTGHFCAVVARFVTGNPGFTQGSTVLARFYFRCQIDRSPQYFIRLEPQLPCQHHRSILS